MQKPWTSKVVFGLAVLVIGGGICLRFFNRGPELPANSPPDIMQKAKSSSSRALFSRQQAGTDADETLAQTNNELAAILALKLPHEKIEEYLALHYRNAASLLAAYYASGDADHPVGDINYLKEAAANFPNDPRVQRTILTQWAGLEPSTFPEGKRKWLDAFKASSPSNSLANYLSAQDYFQNNQPEAAIKELLEASGKSSFGGFDVETFLGEEELYRASGKSPLEASQAALAGMSRELLPELQNLKGIARGIQSAQQQYVNAGDTASVENLAQMGMLLANRFTSGDSGKRIISQLVGFAMEAISLQQLNQNTSYGFLGGETPAQRLEELKQQKAALRELTSSFQAIAPTMTEAERVSYVERAIMFGDVAAKQWVLQQHASNP